MILLLRLNLLYWILLLLVIFAPFVYMRAYLAQVPYTLYYYLIVLGSIKYILLKDKPYKTKLRPKIQKFMHKRTGKVPSSQLVNLKVEWMVTVRDLTLLVFALMGVFVNLIL